MQQPFTVWFTGLPGAGKTTLATLLQKTLSQRGIDVALLDGDAVRRAALFTLGFSRQDRDLNIRVIGFVAAVLNDHGVPAIVSVISPYRDIRDEVRKRIGRFVEVYVRCPIDECIRRDPKGLYAKALAGEISGMTGLDDPYEAPEEPELVVDTSERTPEECLAAIVSYLEAERYIPS
jgi:adenylyl-sulfate kinase